jgi:hypothetical protein
MNNPPLALSLSLNGGHSHFSGRDGTEVHKHTIHLLHSLVNSKVG